MESERKWKLGEDIDRHDNLLDGISFDELILTAHCNCREITPEGVEKGIEERCTYIPLIGTARGSARKF